MPCALLAQVTYTKDEMDVPPSIPTSFVPLPSSAAARRFRGDYTGAFGFFAYGVLAIVFLLAISVFFYGRIRTVTQVAEDGALAKDQAAINQTTASNFVRLRDRLVSGEKLLDGHVAFSNFLTLFDSKLPSTVRFTTFSISLDTKGNIILSGGGIARNFNALAFTSTAFATDGSIKDAIFSGISVNKDNSVSFALSATVDPKVVAFSPPSP